MRLSVWRRILGLFITPAHTKSNRYNAGRNAIFRGTGGENAVGIGTHFPKPVTAGLPHAIIKLVCGQAAPPGWDGITTLLEFGRRLS